MNIKPRQPSAKGPAELFSGEVWIDSLASGQEPSRIRLNLVRFAPSARTAWHAHAVGQTLWVTDGEGLVQSREGKITPIRQGDVVLTPPNEWHWHGAAPDRFMSHISLTEGVEPGHGSEVEWGEHVTDSEYGAS